MSKQIKTNGEYSLSISREKSAALKGLLILLVVIGHNLFFVDVFSKEGYKWLYSFHVAAFFILPFFYAQHEFSWQRVLKYFKRLFWPYTYMFFVLFAVNFFVLKKSRLDFELLNTYLTGNYYTLRDYTIFQYLWFLPAMFSMLVIKDIYTSSSLKIQKVMLCIGALLFFVCWVFLVHQPYWKVINITLAKFSLFSFMMGWAMFFCGLFTRRLMEKVNLSPIVGLFFMLSLLACLLLSASHPSKYQVYILWGVRTVCPTIAFGTLFNGNWYNNMILRSIGELSMPIYLFHQPINAIICRLFLKFNLPHLWLLILSFLIVVFLSWLVTKLFFSIKGMKCVSFPQ